MFTLKLRDNPVGLFKTIPRAQKESVDEVLKEHDLRIEQDLLQVEQGLAPIDGASPALPPGERAPAERIAGPALLLLCSAIMQIGNAAIVVGLALFVAAGGEQGWVMALVGLLGLVSAVPGVVVLVGALKMRGLTDYRFCRGSAIVAMLPLGAGFPLGLPFGIWALLVLRRPDVHAAFTGSANHGSSSG